MIFLNIFFLRFLELYCFILSYLLIRTPSPKKIVFEKFGSRVNWYKFDFTKNGNESLMVVVVAHVYVPREI